MKRGAAQLVISAFAAVFAVSVAAAAPKSASLRINCVMRGCHHWSLSGGPYKVDRTASLALGGTLLVTNEDLMVQALVKTSGPVVTMQLVR